MEHAGQLPEQHPGQPQGQPQGQATIEVASAFSTLVFTLVVNLMTMVGELRSNISRRVGVEFENLVLVFRSTHLENQNSLFFYGIVDGSRITYLVRMNTSRPTPAVPMVNRLDAYRILASARTAPFRADMRSKVPSNYRKVVTKLISDALVGRGVRSIHVVNGQDGMSRIVLLNNEQTRLFRLLHARAQQLGISTMRQGKYNDQLHLLETAIGFLNGRIDDNGELIPDSSAWPDDTDASASASSGPDPLASASSGPDPLASASSGPDPLTSASSGPDPLASASSGPDEMAASAARTLLSFRRDHDTNRIREMLARIRESRRGMGQPRVSRPGANPGGNPGGNPGTNQ